MCPVTENIVPMSPDLLHRWTIIHLYLFIILTAGNANKRRMDT